MNIRCLIIDDEPLAADIIESYVKKIPFLELVARCEDAIEASALLKNTNIDLVFLDINMPGIDGMSFAKTLDKKIQIVFTTAYPEHAVEGFNIKAVDYLLKPIRFERFQQAANTVRAKLQGNEEEGEFILVKVDKIQHKIPLREICFLEGYGDFVKIHTAREVMIGSGSLKYWMEKLPQTGFLRTHKSYIINLDAIDSLDGDKLSTKAGGVPVGYTYKQDVRSALNL